MMFCLDSLIFLKKSSEQKKKNPTITGIKQFDNIKMEKHFKICIYIVFVYNNFMY